MLSICPPVKVSNFLLLHVVIYLVGLRLNHCVFFPLKQLQIFFGKMLFDVTVVLENWSLMEAQKIKT